MVLKETLSFLINTLSFTQPDAASEETLEPLRSAYKEHLSFIKKNLPASSIEVRPNGDIFFNQREPTFKDITGAYALKFQHFEDFTPIELTIQNNFWLRDVFLDFTFEDQSLKTAIQSLLYAYQRFESANVFEQNPIAFSTKQIHHCIVQAFCHLHNDDITLVNKLMGYQYVAVRSLRNGFDIFNRFASTGIADKCEIEQFIDLTGSNFNLDFSYLKSNASLEIGSYSNALNLLESTNSLNFLNSEMEDAFVKLTEKYKSSSDLNALAYDYYCAKGIISSVNSLLFHILLMNKRGFFTSRNVDPDYSDVEKAILTSFFNSLKDCTSHLVLSTVNEHVLKSMIKGNGNIFTPDKKVEKLIDGEKPIFTVNFDNNKIPLNVKTESISAEAFHEEIALPDLIDEKVKLAEIKKTPISESEDEYLSSSETQNESEDEESSSS